MAQYDLSKFSERAGILYYNDKRASEPQSRWHKKHTIGETRPKLQIDKKTASKFTKGFKFNGRSGAVQETYRPMALKQTEKGTVIGSRQVEKFNSKGKTTAKWGSNLDGSHVTILNSFKEWLEYLEIAIHAVTVQSEHFRIMAGQRAMEVFQKSFSYQKFYTANSRKWANLAPYTLRKRAKRHTGSRKLHEYGDLQGSIKIKEKDGLYTTVYTDTVPANKAKHKKLSNCYAGFHNEGEGTYGASKGSHIARPYIRRQFIGHSSYLNPMTDPWLSKMTKRYLFDSVFLSKSSK